LLQNIKSTIMKAIVVYGGWKHVGLPPKEDNDPFILDRINEAQIADTPVSINLLYTGMGNDRFYHEARVLPDGKILVYWDSVVGWSSFIFSSVEATEIAKVKRFCTSYLTKSDPDVVKKLRVYNYNPDQIQIPHRLRFTQTQGCWNSLAYAMADIVLEGGTVSRIPSAFVNSTAILHFTLPKTYEGSWLTKGTTKSANIE
jgi:hypothetical protein